jgi:outer membrane protein assembly factor BamD
VDYAYYLQGLVNFSKNRGITERILPSDMSERDVTAVYASFQNFSELLERFPDSRYAEDASQRMVYLRNILAHNEIHIAGYYLRREAYVAAINRSRFVVENYSRTTAVPDALVVMIKAYRELGLPDLANDTMRVLKLNYPDHPGVREVERFAYN